MSSSTMTSISIEEAGDEEITHQSIPLQSIPGHVKMKDELEESDAEIFTKRRRIRNKKIPETTDYEPLAHVVPASAHEDLDNTDITNRSSCVTQTLQRLTGIRVFSYHELAMATSQFLPRHKIGYCGYLFLILSALPVCLFSVSSVCLSVCLSLSLSLFIYIYIYIII